MPFGGSLTIIETNFRYSSLSRSPLLLPSLLLCIHSDYILSFNTGLLLYMNATYLHVFNSSFTSNAIVNPDTSYIV